MEKFKDLSPELMEKAKACKTGEELAALAAENGIELSDEELEAVSGGASWSCPSNCDSFTCNMVCKVDNPG